MTLSFKGYKQFCFQGDVGLDTFDILKQQNLPESLSPLDARERIIKRRITRRK